MIYERAVCKPLGDLYLTVCDMGESFGRWELGNDAALMALIPTISLGCRLHAGDPHVMRRTLERAALAGVEVASPVRMAAEMAAGGDG